MNRVISTVITVATAATATIAAAAGIAPALAAQRPAQRPAHVRPATHARETFRHAKIIRTLPEEIASEFQGGKYVTLVHCSGTVRTPPPLHLARPDVPLTVRGGGPEAGIVKMLGKSHAYRTIYTCTVIVKVKVPVVVKTHKKTVHHGKKTCEIAAGAPGTGGGKQGHCSHVITLNTGFGGAAGQVAGHHPAG
jgi:hypothetical protein